MSDRLPGYELDLPSPGQVCVSVLRACGDEGIAVWRQVCARAGVPALAAAYSITELERIAGELRSRPGVLSVVGRSLSVRVSSYRTLQSMARVHGR